MVLTHVGDTDTNRWWHDTNIDMWSGVQWHQVSGYCHSGVRQRYNDDRQCIRTTIWEKIEPEQLTNWLYFL